MMKTYKQVKRVVVGIVGGTVVLIGIALIVLPGPAFVVIPAGLAILATEFECARRWLKTAKEKFQSFRSKKTDRTPEPSHSGARDG